MLNKLTWLPILNDLRALSAVGLSPQQRIIVDRMLRNFIIIIFGAGSAIGAMALFIILNLSSGVADTNLVPATETGDTINVPQSPGNTSALTICKNGIVEKATTHIDGGNNSMVNGYSAVLGPERLSYIDNPPGGKNLVVILNGNAQTVQPEVIECLLKRAK